jgi:hypothetical protein
MLTLLSLITCKMCHHIHGYYFIDMFSYLCLWFRFLTHFMLQTSLVDSCHCQTK